MKTVRLGDVADINPRVASELKTALGNEITFLPMDAVGEDGVLRYQDRRQASSVLAGYTLFKKGDVLLAKITPCMENGKAVHLDEIQTEYGAGSTEFHVLRPGSDLDGRFLFYLIWNPIFRRKAERRMTGSAGQKRVPVDFLRDLKISLPSLDEQRRIAAILDKADAIRRKRQQALALADDFLRSTFLEMFGDPVTNSKFYPQAPIKSFGNVVTGNTPSRQNKKLYGWDMEWAKSDNINTPDHYLTKAAEGLSKVGMTVGRIVPAGSTLVTCIAGSPSCIGNAALTDRAVAFNQQINAVVPKAGIHPGFIYTQFLVGKKLVQAASTNSMKGMVSKGQFQEILFLHPPVEEQRKFGEIFERCIKAHKKLTKYLQESESLFASLSQRAFCGEL